MKEENVLVNFIWKFAERCGAQLVSFIVSIILARILMPEDYGVIALVTVFTTILQVFVDSGFGTALIQKKDADELDFSSVFYFNIAVCLVLYATIFVMAPFIASFYNNSMLTDIIRVMGINILISGVKNIQQAYVSRNMLFKKFFFSTLGGTIISAVVGIGLAYMGLGVWALVAQQLTNTAIDTIILWVTVEWRPKRIFSWKRIRSLFSFGWKLLMSSLIDTGYNSLRNLIIGKIYSTTDLACYDQGEKFPKIIVSNINTSIDSVLLPTMSSVSDNYEQIKSMTRRAIMTSTYIMAPLMIGVACCAETIVKIALTEKWLPCVPYIQIFCLSYMLWPIHTANLNAIKAMGRSDLFLKLEIIKRFIGILILLLSMKISVIAIAGSMLISDIIDQIINSWPNKKLLKYSYFQQIKDISLSMIMAIAMGFIVWVIGKISMPILIKFVLQVFVGILVYIVLSILLKNESFKYLCNIIKPYLKKR